MLAIRPADGRLRLNALTLLYSRLPAGERNEQLADALRAERRGEISFEHLLAAVGEGEPNDAIGVALAVRRPGRGAFLWPPVVKASAGSEVGDALLGALAKRLDDAGTAFTQCVVEPDDADTRSVLERNGFPHATDILLMSRPVVGHGDGDDFPGNKRNDPGESLGSVAFSDSLRERFEKTVKRTYEGTLDCPVLQGIRTGEDVLDLHRGTGEFNPARWRLFLHGDLDAGVLLLADHAQRNAWEIAYMGIVPEARGRGFGRRLVREAIRRAELAGRAAIEVAVDAENRFARRIYEAEGFSTLTRMAVHLRVNEAAKRPRVGIPR